jgi:hypothetical protein
MGPFGMPVVLGLLIYDFWRFGPLDCNWAFI